MAACSRALPAIPRSCLCSCSSDKSLIANLKTLNFTTSRTSKPRAISIPPSCTALGLLKFTRTLRCQSRQGRALAQYAVGDRDEGITEMEDIFISLKEYPEVHAAFATALYADRHASLLAENQFTVATLLDPHYTDVSYVKDTKYWQPSLVSSLQLFITLT